MGKHHPIGAGAADPKKLTEIRHAKLGFTAKGDDLQFHYVGVGTTPITPGLDIKTYMKDIAKYSAALPAPVPDPGDASPLDLQSRVPCYFVIELDRKHNWQFQCDAEAISTKADLSTRYCALRHIHGNGTTDPDDGCYVIYFAAINPPGPGDKNRHPFNFHVEFKQDGGKRLPVIIDPDIKYPGGNP